MKKSSKKKENGLLEKVKTIWQIKTVKTTLFFGFYFFFFLFLFLNLDIDSFNNKNNNSNNSQSSETNDNNQDNSEKHNQNSNVVWEFNTLIKDNYGYNYTINENDETIILNGRVSEPNTLIDDYQYNYFLNLYNINQITKNSKFISKNSLTDGYQFNYEISNETLSELLKSNNLTNDKLNKITIYTDSNMVINKIELELTNLMQELNNYSNYKIVLEYKVN